jgi:hypothetical protein
MSPWIFYITKQIRKWLILVSLFFLFNEIAEYNTEQVNIPVARVLEHQVPSVFYGLWHSLEHQNLKNTWLDCILIRSFLTYINKSCQYKVNIFLFDKISYDIQPYDNDNDIHGDLELILLTTPIVYIIYIILYTCCYEKLKVIYCL